MGSLLSNITGFNNNKTMGLDIDFGAILRGAGESAIEQIKIGTASQLLQDPEIQQTIAASGQQAAVQTTAQALVKYQKWILLGGLFVVGGMAFMLLRPKRA